jgi:3-hydroxyacyl-CoA dehydrogenase
MVRRVVSPALKRTPHADALPFVQTVLQTVGSAKVSASAEEARELGFLGDADRVVMNRDHLLFEAKTEVLEMAAAGYAPPVSGDNCFAAGRDVLAALKAGIYVLQQGGYITEYDVVISGKLAHVLCGGDLSAGEWVSEQYLLDLEREVFVGLLQEQRTIDRIQHMLKTGKPLRN